MKSRINGNKYEILRDESDIYPDIIDKEDLDGTLEKLRDALTTIQSIVKETYDRDNNDLYYLLADRVFEEANIDCSDGRIWKINYAIESIDDLQTFLAEHNDEIDPPEKVMTLSDIGFKKTYYDTNRNYLWERSLESTEQKDVDEEIIFNGDEIEHRERTIIWKIEKFGKSSDSITYKDIPISDSLRQIIENTLKQEGC